MNSTLKIATLLKPKETISMTTFAQIPEEVIRALRGVKFTIYSVIRLEEFKGKGVCRLDRESLHAEYGLAYDNLTRNLKLLIADGWIIEHADGSFSTAISAVKAESEPTAKTAVKEKSQPTAEIAVGDANILLFPQSMGDPTAISAVGEPQSTAKIAVNNCENSRNENCSLNGIDLNTQEILNRSDQSPPFIFEAEMMLMIEGVKTRKKTPKNLHKRDEWIAAYRDLYFSNEYSAEYFLAVYDDLEHLRVEKQLGWHITPEVMKNNVGNLDNLKNEIEKMRKNPNGNGNGKSDAKKQERVDGILRDRQKFDKPKLRTD